MSTSPSWLVPPGHAWRTGRYRSSVTMTPEEEVASRRRQAALLRATEAHRLARDDRLLASQRAAVDNAKLVSTFVLALASALAGGVNRVQSGDTPWSVRASGDLPCNT